MKDCAKAAFEPYVERIGKEPAPMQADFISHIKNEQIFVFEQDNDVLAYAVFYRQDDHVFLENIAVHPLHAGKGYGTQLLFFIEQCALDWNLPRIELYTHVKMVESIALYHSLGYIQIDHRTEHGFDRVYYLKTLQE
ncbi:MAG: GNAT family N-acetyltransferase [Granulosicoccus sp.]